jgi:hypothetical protein
MFCFLDEFVHVGQSKDPARGESRPVHLILGYAPGSAETKALSVNRASIAWTERTPLNNYSLLTSVTQA